ncbi:MAG: FlgD immunoglobulin-like domain containing protein [Rubricoccaceae bacterium]
MRRDLRQLVNYKRFLERPLSRWERDRVRGSAFLSSWRFPALAKALRLTLAWIPAFAGMTAYRGYAGNKRTFLKPTVALTILALASLASSTQAQTVQTGAGTFQKLDDGARNGVFILDADAGRLYAGPQLVVVGPDGRPQLVADDPAFDPRTAVDPRAVAIEAQGDDIWVALAFDDRAFDADEPPLTAAGFAVSEDGGQTWTPRFAPLDETRDTTVTLGANTLRAVPIVDPQGAPTLDIAFTPDGDTVYVASFAGGLRRSTDGGASFTRLVLPPDSLTSLDPRETYAFELAPQGTFLSSSTLEAPIRSQFGLNFYAQSLLLDETGTLWVGTLFGLNRSSRVEGTNELAWTRYSDGPFGGGPSGNEVIALEAQPVDGARDPIWIASAVSSDEFSAPDEEDGVVVWRGDDADGGPIFDPVLLGVRVQDFAFGDGVVYAAAGRDGLHISTDDGVTWRSVQVYRDATGAALPIRPDAGTFAVEVIGATVWVGTPDGLLRSDDGARTWTLFRASPAPGTTGGSTPREVEVYAFPNPYTPRSDGDLRVRFELASPSDVTVRIFDVGMNTIRQLDAFARPQGANEVLWDGRADDGSRVANGAYIYVVTAEGRQLSGSILVFN